MLLLSENYTVKIHKAIQGVPSIYHLLIRCFTYPSLINREHVPIHGSPNPHICHFTFCVAFLWVLPWRSGGAGREGAEVMEGAGRGRAGHYFLWGKMPPYQSPFSGMQLPMYTGDPLSQALPSSGVKFVSQNRDDLL